MRDIRVSMDIQHQAAFLRAARAWIDQDQRSLAAAVGIGLNTLVAAERGNSCTDKTWRRMVEHYASIGIETTEIGGVRLIVICD